LFQIPIKVLLRLAAVTRINDLYRIFEAEIRESRYELAEKLDRNLDQVQKVAFKLIAEIMDRYILSLPVQQLTKGITREQVGWTARNVLQSINESPAFMGVFDTGLQKLTYKSKYKSVSEIVDIETLQTDLLNSIQQLTTNDRFRSDLGDVLTYTTDLLIRNEDQRVLSILDDDTVDFASQVLAKSGINSLEEHLAGIINAVNIKGVTEREINKMDPEQIDKLFDSFARAYFRKLERYGLTGGLVGLGTSSAYWLKYLLH